MTLVILKRVEMNKTASAQQSCLEVDKTLHGGVGSYLLFHMALALVEQVSGGATATGSARASPRIKTQGALG